MLIPAVLLSLHFRMIVYRSGPLVTGRFLEDGLPVLPSSSSLEVVELPPSTLLEISPGTDCSILVVPGLDPYEYQKVSPYIQSFIERLKKAKNTSRVKCSVFLYRYPSMFESFKTSGDRLAKLAAGIKNAVVIAHSKGGLVVWRALEHRDFRSGVKRVYFLGTPHTGTPYADVMFMDPGNFEEELGIGREEADLVRLSLAFSYTVGYVAGVGTRDLIWRNQSLPKLVNYPGVEYYFVAGIVRPSLEELKRALRISLKKGVLMEGLGTIYLALIGELVGRDPFVPSDGLVPVRSALAIGESVEAKRFLLIGYNHAALYKDVKLLVEMMLGKDPIP